MSGISKQKCVKIPTEKAATNIPFITQTCLLGCHLIRDIQLLSYISFQFFVAFLR